MRKSLQILWTIAAFTLLPTLLFGATAHDWLASQQTSTGLVDSYEDDNGSRAYTYDQSLAVIAFTAENDLVRARAILDRLVLLQGSDGSWLDFYYAVDGKPGFGQLTGNSIWVVIAMNYYTLQTGDTRYVASAKKCADWFLIMQMMNPTDKRYGSILGGPGIAWTSTEHNQDAYSALKYLGYILNDPYYTNRANLVYNWLTRKMWNRSAGNFYVGLTNETGSINRDEYLDIQTWGVASLGAYGPMGEDYGRAISWAYTKMQITRGYHGNFIEGFQYQNISPHGLWFEGTEQTALALEILGDSDNSDFYHSQVGLAQSANGGVIAAVGDGDLWWSCNYPLNGAAAASWFIFCSHSPKINPLRPIDPADTEPPSISSVGIANVTPDSAVVYWWADEPGAAEVEYGTTTAYGSYSASGAELTSHAILLSNLSSQTTYHFRVKSMDYSGNVAFGEDQTFTTATAPPDTEPPSLSSIGVSNITLNSAVVFWMTDENSNTQIDYGTTVDYGNSTPLNNALTQSHGVALSNLLPNTTYHYRVKSSDASGNLAVSEDLTFATPDTVPPEISSVNVSPINSFSVNVSWLTDENSNSEVAYGGISTYTHSVSSSAMVRGHSLVISNLSAHSTYRFQVRSTDAAGNRTVTANSTFTTPSAP